MLGHVNIADAPYDVSVTQLYGVFGKRRSAGSRKYVNTLKGAQPAPIGMTTDPNIALLSQNEQRKQLIIQNNSVATDTNPVQTDFAPSIFIGFSVTAVPGLALQLDPGEAIVLDYGCPADAIYITVGPFSNIHNTVIVQGIAQEFGVTDDTRDTANGGVAGQLAQLISLLQAQFGAEA